MNNKNLKILIAGCAFLAILILTGIFIFYPQADKSQQEVPLKDFTTPVPAENWGTLSEDTPLTVPLGAEDLESPFVVVPEELPADPGETSVTTVTETATPRSQVTPQKPSTVTPPPARTPVPKPVPTVKVTEFWIQVAAYSDKYAAERSAQTLSAQNLAAVLFTAQNDRGTVYRVRIGPYNNKQEAEKYLGWVKALKDFSSAYVTQSTALREVK